MILSVNVPWPRSLETIMRASSLLDFDVDVVNLGCLVNSSWPAAFAVQAFPAAFAFAACKVPVRFPQYRSFA